MVASEGTIARNCVSESIVNSEAAVPLNAASVVPVKLSPSIVTSVPMGPLSGVKEAMTGVEVTMKSSSLVPLPASFRTCTCPVVASAGTTA